MKKLCRLCRVVETVSSAGRFAFASSRSSRSFGFDEDALFSTLLSSKSFATSNTPHAFQKPKMPESLGRCKTVVAVASGKGGVGKSTVCVNLAVASRKLGLKRVGILDADVFGPSIPLLMNLRGLQPRVVETTGKNQNRRKMMIPLENHGIKCMSMGFLLPDDRAAVWRGPMVMGALAKLVNETMWNEGGDDDDDGSLDALFVDMPPGTGDAHITIAQKLPITGAVVVSTPNEISLIDARRATDMYAKVDAKILGIVENMAWFSNDGGKTKSYPFGEGGARKFAKELQVPFLGEVPILSEVNKGSDEGRPVASSLDNAGEGPHDHPGKVFRDIARKFFNDI